MEVDVDSGYIVLRHTLGWSPVAWAIRTVTESFWNHAGGIVEDDDGSVWVIEADPPVVKKTPIAEFINPKKYNIKIVALKPEAFKDRAEYEKAVATAVNFLRAKIGFRYDKRAIVWLAISYTFLGALKWINPLNSRKEFFCSELVCQAWHGTSSIVEHLFAGLKHPEAECDVTTPKDVGKTVNVQYIAGKDVK